MREYISTISSKGQITIPIDVRRKLGVEPEDKVVFVLLDDNTFAFRPVQYRVADLRGVVPGLPGGESDDFESEIADAFEEKAEQLGREINGS